MRPIGEKEIPKMENFWQRRRTCTERQDGGKGVEFGMHALAEEMIGQLGLNYLETSVNELQTSMDTIHCTSNVTRAFSSHEVVEEGESLHFTAGSV